MFSQLMSLLQQNRFPAAKALCAQLCQANPKNAQLHFIMSAICGQLGNLAEGEQHCSRSIELNPNVPESWYNLAVIQLKLDKHAAAIESLQRALQLKPAFPEAMNELGNAYQRLGQPAKAIPHYLKATQIKPDFASAYCNLAAAQMQMEDMAGASKSLKTALTLNPNLAEAHQQLGILHHRQGDDHTAIGDLETAIRLNPGMHNAQYTLGSILAARGETTHALKHFTAAMSASPDNVEYLNAAATALKDSGNFAESETHYRKAIGIAPNNAKLLSNYGLTLIELNKTDEAITLLTRATELDPDLAEAHYNLGTALGHATRLSDAEAAYIKAIAIRHEFPEAWMNLGVLQLLQGRNQEAIASFEQTLKQRPDYAEANSNLLMALNYTETYSATEIALRHREWGQKQTVGSTAPASTPTSLPGKPHRLRIGFVSADFRSHSVAHFFESLIDPRPELAEVICYSNTTKPDHVTSHIRERVSQWRDITGLSDPAAAELIRTDQLDILIDLSGHTSGNRLGIFALRPCSIQMTYLGYPNTTGLTTIDYRITDGIADPEDDQRLYPETLLRLERCFLCYSPAIVTPAPYSSAQKPQRPTTFGSFNNLAKITPELIGTWAQILLRTPGSHLLLKNRPLADKQVAARFRQEFARHGVEPERLQLLGWATGADHLETYNQIDIALDTYPYNGTTTTCEALWMGRPVVTETGAHHASRVGTSLLSSIGLSELIATSTDGYIEIAANLAKDPASLVHMHGNLRDRMLHSPLCDKEDFQKRFYAELNRIVVGQ